MGILTFNRHPAADCGDLNGQDCGTNQDNIPDYIDAGVLILGASFSMIEKETMRKIVDEQDYDLLAHELIAVKHLIDTLRAEKYPDIDFAKASLEEISRVTGRDFNIGD